MSKIKGDPGYRDGWCIHYQAPDERNDGKCEAGVSYEQFMAGGFHRKPCFLDKGKPRPDAQHCQHLRLPTPEEIAAHKQWADERWKILGTVMTGIMPWRKANKGKSISEVVECPACKGKLHLSIAAYNGHVHGKCETEGCVSWME